MDRHRKRRFKKHCEPWALAVLCGRISWESENAAEFLRVHHGQAEPSTEIEKLWIEYWDGKPPQVSALKDLYLKRAVAMQRSGSSYDGIVHAYKLAALCGSEQAHNWLQEQKLEPLRINTIWRSIDKEIWDLNG